MNGHDMESILELLQEKECEVEAAHNLIDALEEQLERREEGTPQKTTDTEDLLRVLEGRYDELRVYTDELEELNALLDADHDRMAAQLEREQEAKAGVERSLDAATEALASLTKAERKGANDQSVLEVALDAARQEVKRLQAEREADRRVIERLEEDLNAAQERNLSLRAQARGAVYRPILKVRAKSDTGVPPPPTPPQAAASLKPPGHDGSVDEAAVEHRPTLKQRGEGKNAPETERSGKVEENAKADEQTRRASRVQRRSRRRRASTTLKPALFEYEHAVLEVEDSTDAYVASSEQKHRQRQERAATLARKARARKFAEDGIAETAGLAAVSLNQKEPREHCERPEVDDWVYGADEDDPVLPESGSQRRVTKKNIMPPPQYLDDLHLDDRGKKDAARQGHSQPSILVHVEPHRSSHPTSFVKPRAHASRKSSA